MKTTGLVLLYCIVSISCSYAQNVISADIDHFWEAYDSMRTTTDSVQQGRYLQRLYIDRGTAGLKAFMEVREYTPEMMVSIIRRYPRYWNSIRPETFRMKARAKEFGPAIAKLKALYPALRPAAIYLTVGAMRSGGTTSGDKVLIGAELSSGNAQTDVSEFPTDTQQWLSKFFKTDPMKDLVLLNIHEYVHTQEHGAAKSLLAQSIYEGTCDFVAQKALGALPSQEYVTYGPAHEAMLKDEFRLEMYTDMWRYWLYNGTLMRHGVRDLGYFMGYAICAAYYKQARDKKGAIRDMIELDYSDEAAVEAFLAKSGYYAAGTVNKTDMEKLYNAKRPSATETSVIRNSDTQVDPSLTEIRIHFSEPMAPNISMELGEGGREHYPVVGRGVFADDGMSIVFKVSLKPDYAYAFMLSGGGFRSKNGYPLKDYVVTFRTRK